MSFLKKELKMTKCKEVKIVTTGTISDEELRIMSKVMLIVNHAMRGKTGKDIYDLKCQATAVINEFVPPDSTPGKMLYEHCFFSIIEETPTKIT